MGRPIKENDLLFHVLNVGLGDNIIIEFPGDEDHKRSYGIVDCYRSQKTKSYLQKLRSIRPGYSNLKFVCATHPHLDHIAGIRSLLTDAALRPEEFWDSGFRHASETYVEILESLAQSTTRMERISSGMEKYYGTVQVTALAPSVGLRNRYLTWGVDINNASIVLRFENHDTPMILASSKKYTSETKAEVEKEVSPAVVILAGDAQFDSWSRIVDEYPRLEGTAENEPALKKLMNYLKCSVVKVPHHGSMHSAPLDIYEIMKPSKAIISSKQEESTLDIGSRKLTRELYPHQSAIIALEESETEVATTDGDYESSITDNGRATNQSWAHEGSIVVVVPPGRKPEWKKLGDRVDDVPDPPQEV